MLKPEQLIDYCGPKEGQRIVYTCKKCGWKSSILVAWGDIRPKKCAGRRCQRNKPNAFLKYTEDLLILKPQLKETKSAKKKYRKYKKK